MQGFAGNRPISRSHLFVESNRTAKKEPTMTETPQDPKMRLLDAAVTHVPFDGWSEGTFQAVSYTHLTLPTICSV